MREILNMAVGVALLLTAFPRPLGAGIIAVSTDVGGMALPASMPTPRQSLLDEHVRPLMGWMGESCSLILDMDQSKFMRFSRPIDRSSVMLEPPRVDFQGIRIYAGNGEILSNNAMVSTPMVRKKSETHAKGETMMVPDTATLLLLALGSLLFICDRRWRLGFSK